MTGVGVVFSGEKLLETSSESLLKAADESPTPEQRSISEDVTPAAARGVVGVVLASNSAIQCAGVA